MVQMNLLALFWKESEKWVQKYKKWMIKKLKDLESWNAIYIYSSFHNLLISVLFLIFLLCIYGCTGSLLLYAGFL